MDNSFSFNDLPTINPAFDNMTLKPGVEIDTYELLQKIGHGGMGEVWKARDLAGNRDVALKFVPRDIQNHAEEMARVDETFQTVHQLHHQHICPMHSLRRHPDFGAYLMMDFIDGIPLSLYLRYVKKLSLPRALEILRPLAEALDYAHSKNVIHRDIKPGNVMLVFEKNGDGTWNFEELRDVQLIDFGLASEFRQSMTRVSQVRMGTSGTMPYMSPEQFRGEYQDAHSDQYSLGTMAYEMLAGHLPFMADEPTILGNCVTSIPPLPLDDQPETVNAALLRALAKPRKDRFATCAEFVNALTSRKPSRPAPVSKPKFPLLGVAVLLILALLAGMMFVGKNGETPEEAKILAESKPKTSEPAPVSEPPKPAVRTAGERMVKTV
ncbi:MAG: serine/threonine-protein kinase, partial [Planctomycetia bacterium]|nr:serine/threonine-protein kinase [Planctomycetia bacterium]